MATKSAKQTADTGSYKHIVPPNATFITKNMHIQLLEWKLAHGKRRPMLMKYAKELDEAQVEEVSRSAFALCDEGKYMEAIEKYRTLKGTGYALASLVLSTRTDRIPFMSDELLGTLYPDANGKFKYNKKEFLACFNANQ